MSNVSVIMLGTGSPRLDLNRSASAHVLLAGDLPIVVDCAEGTTHQLLKAGIHPKEVKHLCFTHLHADHALGYGQFLIAGWVEGRRELTVTGPRGTKKFHEKLLEMFEEDIAYRMSLGRPASGLTDVNIIEVDTDGRIQWELPVQVTAARMNHSVPTFAYRFDIEGQSVVFSGDTAPPTDALIQLSNDADILIHDSCLTMKNEENRPDFQKIWESLQKEHCTPAQAAYTALQANVKQLVLTHFLPEIDEVKVYQEATEVFPGKVIVARDFDKIEAGGESNSEEQREVLNALK